MLITIAQKVLKIKSYRVHDLVSCVLTFCSDVVYHLRMANTVRINISVPKDFIAKVRSFAPNGNISKFFVKTVEEKIKDEERIAAMKFFEEAGPLFPEIKDSATYVHDMRQKETKHRMRKIGI
jgi:hypothetical protein